MNRRLKLTLGIFMLFIIAACYKRDALQKGNFIDANMARAWLQKNGLSYRKEIIDVSGPNGQVVTGKLNWQKAKQVSWEGRDYLDIPFEFVGYGTVIPASGEAAPASFNLVLRKTVDGGFEGAVRTTMHIGRHEIQGNSLQSFQSYQLLDGQPGNIWMIKGPERELIATHRLNIDPITAANMKLEAMGNKTRVSGTGADRLMVEGTPNCPPRVEITYQQTCVEQNGDPMDVKCIVSPVVTYVPADDCNPNNPTPPPSGTGGGSGNPGGNPGYPPGSDDGENTEKKNPCDEAIRLANEILVDFNNTNIKGKIDQLKSIAKTSKLEVAFKFGVSNTTGEYKTTDFFRGNKSAVSYTYSANNFTEKGGAHLHPLDLDGVPSAGDIYSFYDDVSVNTSYLYDLVVWNDDLYMLGIVDRTEFTKFINKYPESKHYDTTTHGWSSKSIIRRSYFDILDNYYNLYGNKAEAVEAALAYIIDEYKMGIILQKWDSSINKFKPLRRLDIQYKNNTGAVSGFGNNSPYESITIKGCND